MSIKQLIADIRKTNLAIGMDKDKLEKIGYVCAQGYEDDLGDPDRAKWEKNVKDYIKLAMQIIEPKSDPWPGCANIKTPLLTQAAIQFNARAYPALVPPTNIVKTTKTGADPEGQKSERGERIGKHMSYQLQEEMEEWEGDMDKGLLILPIVGCFFKKTFYNVDLGRNESSLVMPQNLVMKYDVLSIERAPRLSEEISFYPREVKEKQKSKTWLDIEIKYVDEEKETLEKFVTQHTTIDLHDNGYKIPYIVTFQKETKKVLRIVANYTKADIWYNDGTEVISSQISEDRINRQNQSIDNNNIEALAISQQAGTIEDHVEVPKRPETDYTKYKVLRVDPTKYYTKYGFLPSPDGGIYDVGLGQLMGPLTDAADTLVNQSLDAGSLSNNQGGFRAKGIKAPAGNGRVNVNEWTEIETGSRSLQESLLPFNFKGPSSVALALVEFLVGFAKEVANLKDILSGDAPQGETATTSMIKREEGMRIYNAIYKRVYRSFKAELLKLYDLNSLYLPQEGYFMVLDEETAIAKADYSHDKTDVRPAADPTESTQSQKIMKAEAGLQFVQDPEFNGYELKKNYLEAIDYPSIDTVLVPPDKRPKQPPNPELVKITAEVAEIEAKTKKTLLETAEVISKVILNLATAESKEAGDQLSMLQAHADILIKKGVANGTNQEGNRGMAQQPGDQGNQGPTPQEAAGVGGLDGLAIDGL